MTYQTATIRSPNCYSGRLATPRLIVLHTAECPCTYGSAINVANYLANEAVQASCHWVTDPGWVVEQVDEADTAWAAPGGNSDGIQIEQAGRAGFTSADWATPDGQAMLRVTAELMAGISQRWNIPLVHLSNAELEAGHAGVVGHVQVSQVYRRSDHWDPGDNYPIDQVIELARGGGLSAAGKVAPPPPIFQGDDDDMPLKTYRVEGDPRVWVVRFPFKMHATDADVLWAWQNEGWVEWGEPKVMASDVAIKPLTTVDEYGTFEGARPAT